LIFTIDQIKSQILKLAIVYDIMQNMTTKIIFVTGNKYKVDVARKSLVGSGIELVQKKMETPEIQSGSVEEIAAFSAKWAADSLNKPAVVSDGGCYIEALNGFPGPFIKYINKWLSAENMINLMRGETNRRVMWSDCIAYCEPGKKPKTFVCNFRGEVATKAGKVMFRKDYGFIDTIFIPKGYLKTLSELPMKDYLNFWTMPEGDDNWPRLGEYLKKRAETKIKS